MSSGIYAIVNSHHGKVYVGSTVSFGHRWEDHKIRLRLDFYFNGHLQNAWNMCGEAAFQFIICEYVDDIEALTEREQYWLDFHRMLVGVYNVKLVIEPPKTRKKRSPKVYKMSAERRHEMSRIRMGNKHTEEAKQKMKALGEKRRALMAYEWYDELMCFLKLNENWLDDRFMPEYL